MLNRRNKPIIKLSAVEGAGDSFTRYPSCRRAVPSSQHTMHCPVQHAATHSNILAKSNLWFGYSVLCTLFSLAAAFGAAENWKSQSALFCSSVKGAPYRWRNAWRFLIKKWGKNIFCLLFLFQQHYETTILTNLTGCFRKFAKSDHQLHDMSVRP
jgi:hypothetical protein